MPQFVVAVIVAISAIAVSGRPAAASPESSPTSAPGLAPEIGYPVHMDISAPLRTLPQNQEEEVSDRGKDRGPKKFRSDSGDPTAGSAPSSSTSATAPATINNFDGVGQGFTGPAGTFSVTGAPPDPNGAIGPNHYVETVNTSFAIFNRAGTPIYGPVKINTLWSGFGGGCQVDNDGDPSVVYDRIADRWLISQFAVTTTKYLNCVAVSTTPDPTGSYYRYSYLYSDFPDYPKFGLWPDGYYVSFNMFRNGIIFRGGKACSYDRSKMLAGLSAPQVCFNTSTSYGGLLPSTLDGSRLPPTGSPNYFVALNTTTTLVSWKFHVDWATPASSTWTGPTSLTVAPYAEACGGGTCIPQPGTTQQLDSLADRLMYRLAYRNFSDHEALVVNHSVTAGSSVGIRWYELRVASGALTVFQQGTYAPDSNYRWMGSIAMDQAGDIALGFSESSTALKPSIRYTGRLAGDPLGTMTQGEGSIINGGGSQLPSLSRWGDYSSMAVDPVDDCTFWYTNQYLKANGTFNWSTRIGSFKFPSCGVTVASVSPTSGPVAGGTGVTITGTNFSSGATVAFGGVAATGTVVVNATTITTTTPGHAAGAVDVTVTVGPQTGTCSSCFTYIPPPTVVAINPTSGPAAGGTSVTVTGTGFDPAGGATTARFGPNAATGVSCASTTSCVATSPIGSGTVHITVTVGGSASAAAPADQFTYVTAFPDDPIVFIDAPAPGATVSGTTLIRGWAIDRNGTSGTGVDSVTLYLDGAPGTGTLVGTAVYGDSRPDVGTYYGSSRFDNSGWHLSWNTASSSNGSHTLYVVVHSSVSGTSNTVTRAVNVTAFPGDPIGFIDAPAPGATVSGTTPIRGWGIDRNSTTGTGVDSVTLYLDGAPGTGTLLGTAVYGDSRPDVGTYYGSSRFDNSGWHLSWNTASTANGSHTLYAVVHSSVSGTSNTVTRAVNVAP